MDFVSLLSGGKDSCYNTFQCIRHGHRLICLAHLRPTPVDHIEGEETNSFMYQTAGSNVLKAYEECLGVPMLQRQIIGTSLNTNLEYNDECPGDEVEDLYLLLRDVLNQYPSIKGVACGAILSNYQRHRLEHICGRLGLTVLSYLWQKDRKELLQEMVFEHNMEIMLVKVAGAGLQPRKHLGKRLKDLYPNLLALHKKYGLDLCGEGGEYESLVLDAPFFRKRIEIVSSKIIEDPEDPDVGNLYILSHVVVEKTDFDAQYATGGHSESNREEISPAHQLNQSLQASMQSIAKIMSSSIDSSAVTPHVRYHHPVRIHWKQDGFGHTELISAPQVGFSSKEKPMADIYKLQFSAIMDRLVKTLHSQRPSVCIEDIFFVHLYLRDMSMFAVINEEYCRWFARYAPPSRSCVQLTLTPTDACVALEACILRDSRLLSTNSSTSSKMVREVLHVQSMSQWAPLCIGPYCQANILRQFFVFVAGQIPLQPGTMALRNHAETPLSREDLFLDLTLSLRHVQRVLSVLQSQLKQLLTVVVYVNMSEVTHLLLPANDPLGNELWKQCHDLVVELVRQNRFVGDSGVALQEEKTRQQKLQKQQQQQLDGNYSDEDYSSDCEAHEEEDLSLTDCEDGSTGCVLPPVIIVGVPGLPRNASCEVETVAVQVGKLREKGWKACHHSTVLSTSSSQSDLTRGGVTDVENWPLWTEPTSIPSSLPADSPLCTSSQLQVEVTMKTFPGTVCSGTLSVACPLDDCLSVSTTNIVTAAVTQLKQYLREFSAMRSNRLFYVKLFFDPVEFDCLLSCDGLVQMWHEEWRNLGGTDVSLASVIALPVKILSSTKQLLQVSFLAMDAMQLEAESWVNLASNHCQGS